MTMTKLPMGCSGGLIGVTAPLTSWSAQDLKDANALSGSGRAALVLKAPAQDATTYTPAAQLAVDMNDVEDAHMGLPAEAKKGMANVAALSAQENWTAGRLNPFSNLWGPMCDWLAELVSPKSLDSALVLAGAQASDLSVPVALQMALTDLTVGKPVGTTSKSSLSSGPSPVRKPDTQPLAQKTQKPWWVYYRPAPHR